MFDYLIVFILIGSWFFWLPGRYDGDQIFVLSALMAVSAAGHFVRPYRAVNTKWLAACVFVAIGVMFLNFAWFKIYMMTNLTLGVLSVKVIAERITNKRLIQTVLLAGCWLSGLLLLWDKNLYHVMFNDTGAMFGKPWALGSFVAIALPLVARLNPLYGLAAAPLLFASRSSVCVLAGFMGIVWAYGSKSRLIAIMTGLMGILGAAFTIFREGGLENHRFEVWKNSFKYAMEAPIFGHGIGSWAHMGFAHTVNGEMQHWPWAHNEFYQQFFELGVLGLVCVVGFLWSVRRCSREVQGSLIAMLLIALFHPVLHWAKLIPACVVVFAIAVKESTGEKNEIFSVSHCATSSDGVLRISRRKSKPGWIWG